MDDQSDFPMQAMNFLPADTAKNSAVLLTAVIKHILAADFEDAQNREYLERQLKRVECYVTSHSPMPSGWSHNRRQNVLGDGVAQLAIGCDFAGALFEIKDLGRADCGSRDQYRYRQAMEYSQHLVDGIERLVHSMTQADDDLVDAHLLHGIGNMALGCMRAQLLHLNPLTRQINVANAALERLRKANTHLDCCERNYARSPGWPLLGLTDANLQEFVLQLRVRR